MNIIGNRVPFQAKSMQLKPAQVKQEQPEKVEAKETEQAPETKNANPTAESVEVLGTPSYLAQRGIKIVSSTTPLSATSADEIVETEVVDDEEVVTNDADTDAAKTKQYAQKKPTKKGSGFSYRYGIIFGANMSRSNVHTNRFRSSSAIGDSVVAFFLAIAWTDEEAEDYARKLT